MFAPVRDIKINRACFINVRISPSNIPFSMTVKDEKVPPSEAAIAHIFIELATSTITLYGGWFVNIAPNPEKREAPITTPKAIKKFCITLV